MLPRLLAWTGEPGGCPNEPRGAGTCPAAEEGMLRGRVARAARAERREVRGLFHTVWTGDAVSETPGVPEGVGEAFGACGIVDELSGEGGWAPVVDVCRIPYTYNPRTILCSVLTASGLEARGGVLVACGGIL